MSALCPAPALHGRAFLFVLPGRGGALQKLQIELELALDRAMAFDIIATTSCQPASA